MTKLALTGTLLTAFLLVSFSLQDEQPEQKAIQFDGDPFIGHYYPGLKDTLFTNENCFIELNLTTQEAVLYTRNGYVKPFKISSGTDRLLDGVNTKPGLFVIQSMQRRWHSRQFDSTLMLYWMGFNYGIGFHGLASDGYYRHLGVRPSSHGCVRIAREDGAELYDIVTLHSPVLVHTGDPAVAIGFTDSMCTYKTYDHQTLKKTVLERYEYLYSGSYFLYKEENLLLRRENVTHLGLPIGEGSKVEKRQKIYRLFQDSSPEIIDKFAIHQYQVYRSDIDSIDFYNSILDDISNDKNRL